ncbi:transcriptional regulator [Sphaerisporangium siamense]|nr:transcriptional regulator [Sphaerisporangium siamense]
MSSFQKAREELGSRLRELRRDARLTGRQLAESHGWHPTKISKIEGGKQTPSDADLEAWAAACGAPERAPELIAALRSLEGRYVQYRRMFRSGASARQRTFAEFEAESLIVRNFETCFVPGLLQTPEYARFRLAEGISAHAAPDDLDEAVAARMQRQQVLYATGKRFHFVLAESVLRFRLCPVEVMTAQLERLAVASTMRTIRVGVIPFDVPYPAAPIHGFWIFDDRHVSVETVTAALTLTEETDVRAYLDTFARLADAARYGAEARAVITRVLAELPDPEP